MKISRFFLFIVLTTLGVASARSTEFSANAMFGYNAGPGFRFGGTVSDFAKGFPLAVEIAAGYSMMDPGDPLRARRIFINNNTNGTPEENGHAWDIRLDFLYTIPGSAVPNLAVLAGVRRSLFVGDFKYVGGNEDFEVTANQWGLGLGGRTMFPIGRNLGLVVSAGVDYYFKGTLAGHDTEYTPEDENINSKEDYTYADADKAIHQPGFSPIAMIGLSLGF